jgi:hypothetical protein
MAEPEVLVSETDASKEHIGKNVQSLVQKLVDNGWTIGAVGYSKAYFAPEVYASGDKAGETHGEATNEYNWIHAYHLDRKRTLSVSYMNDRFESCLWNRRNNFSGELVDSGEMNELIKGSWEDKLPGEMWKLFKAERAAENKKIAAEKAAAVAERKRIREEAKNG